MTATPSASPFAPLPAVAPVRRAAIAGIGHALPADILTNAELEKRVETSDTWIMERTGIRERRRVGSGETASTLGAEAGRRAMEAAGNPPIDTIICATVTPDTLFPSSACLIQRTLGLSGAAAFDINAACSGFVYGITLASSLIASGAATNVLLIAADALTTLVDYGDRSTCVLFGDGAGAVVLRPTDGPGIRATRWHADGEQGELIYYGPANDADASQSTDERVRMMGKGTFKLAVDRLCAMATELADDCGWTVEDVDHFVPHQANQRIIELAAKRLGVPMDKVIVNVEHVGNTSGASIPIALSEAMDAGTLGEGDKLICVAFGAGATWGGVALEWTSQWHSTI